MGVDKVLLDALAWNPYPPVTLGGHIRMAELRRKDVYCLVVHWNEETCPEHWQTPDGNGSN
jgi:hypothetical protein